MLAVDNLLHADCMVGRDLHIGESTSAVCRKTFTGATAGQEEESMWAEHEAGMLHASHFLCRNKCSTAFVDNTL